jgi:hypothetical protein
VNVAVTDLLPFIGTLHVPESLLQAPDQPPNVELASGAALTVTIVSEAKS